MDRILYIIHLLKYIHLLRIVRILASRHQTIIDFNLLNVYREHLILVSGFSQVHAICFIFNLRLIIHVYSYPIVFDSILWKIYSFSGSFMYVLRQNRYWRYVVISWAWNRLTFSDACIPAKLYSRHLLQKSRCSVAFRRKYICIFFDEISLKRSE